MWKVLRSRFGKLRVYRGILLLVDRHKWKLVRKIKKEKIKMSGIPSRVQNYQQELSILFT
jgi:hypothetical protein